MANSCAEAGWGFVLPAELLSTGCTAPVRRYLAERFRAVDHVDERVFPGVLAEVVLLPAEGAGPTDCSNVPHARNLRALADRLVTHARPIDLEAALRRRSRRSRWWHGR